MSWRDRAIPETGYLAPKKSWRDRAIIAEKQDETSPSQALLEQYGNTALLGYLPHIQAGVEKLMPDPGADVDAELEAEGFTINQPESSYIESRDKNLKRLAKQEEEHPIASTIGKGAGILATAAIPMGQAAKGASLLDKTVKGAKGGALLGAAINPGDKENEIDPLQILDRGKNATIGLMIGATAPSVIEKGASTAQQVSDYLKNKAALKATRALGRPTPTQAQKMSKSGQDVALGRDLLDEGAIPYFGTPERIAKRVEGIKEKAGQEIGDLIDAGGASKAIDSEKLAIEILDSPEIKQMRMTPGMESTVSAIEKQVETLAKNGQLTLKQAQALRQGIDKSINFNKSAPEMRGAQEGLYKQRTAIRDAMNDAINELPGNQTKDALKIANRKYGNMSEASDLLEKEIARNQANRSVSLTDTIAGAGGLTAGGIPGAIATSAANKFGRKFGNSLQARVYDAIAKKTGKSAASLATKNPGKVAGILTRGGSEVQRDFELEDDPILNNERLMKLFRDDPSLIESISDERTKSKVKRAISSE